MVTLEGARRSIAAADGKAAASVFPMRPGVRFVLTLKTVKQIHPATRDDIGDLTTRRPLPSPTLNRLGAFLFLNHHGPQTYAPGNNGLPFGPHPHRGFETVTFILDGALVHRDSAGHESVIRAGGVHWMTPPRYVGLQREAIPAIVEDGGRAVVNLISGFRNGKEGPIRSLTGVFMSTLQLRAGGRIQFDGLRGRNVFLHIVRGEVGVEGHDIAAFRLVELNEGDMVVIEGRMDAYILFGHADPINEPVVSQGPFVMNSEDEIRQAYAEFRAGKFGIPQ